MVLLEVVVAAKLTVTVSLELAPLTLIEAPVKVILVLELVKVPLVVESERLAAVR